MKNNSFKTSTRRFVIWQTVFVFTVLLGAGCKKDRDIGLEIQPEGSLDLIQVVDTFAIKAQTYVSDPQPSSQFQNFVGTLNNAQFGRATAEVYVNFELQSENVSLEFPAEDYVIDDVVWIVYPFQATGNPSEPMRLSVHMLDEVITSDSSYRSDVDFLVDESPIGTHEIQFDSPETVQNLPLDTTYPGEQITLDEDLGAFLLKGLGNDYTNSDELQEYFPGLVLRVDNPESINQGALYDFALAGGNIGLLVYFHLDGEDPDDNEVLQFEINNSTARVNGYTHDYSGSEVEQYLNSTPLGKEKLFVQGMSGVKASIDIPYLDEFGSKNEVVLSAATLTVKTDEGQTDGINRSEQLYLLDRILNSEGDTIETFNLDFATGTSRHGGLLSDDRTEYVFDITRTVQNIFQEAQLGNDVNVGFTLNAQVPVLNDNVVDQNVLKGSNNIVLKLYYTDIKED